MRCRGGEEVVGEDGVAVKMTKSPSARVPQSFDSQMWQMFTLIRKSLRPTYIYISDRTG